MNQLNKIALVVSKVLEVLHWIGTAAAAGLLICTAVAGEWIGGILTKEVPELGKNLCVYGFEMTAVGADGKVRYAAVILFSIGAVLILSLMAMVFRNIYLIFKTAKGKTWFSKGSTPFQKDITRMVREIGIFYIAVPASGLIMSGVSRLVLGVEFAEISVNLEGFITGILILCLSQIFAYGVQLQNDVDGLL